MAKVKVLIVEDEVIVAEELAEILADNGYSIVGRLATAEEALRKCREETPELAILDINIDGSRNGLALASKMMADYDIGIVFLTAYDNEAYIKEAAELGAAGYVHKPFDTRHLLTTLKLAEQKLKNGIRQVNGHTQVLKDRIFIRENDLFSKIMYEDVSFVEATGSYCTIVVGTRTITLAINLKTFSSRAGYPYFVRVHRSFLINVKKVDTFSGNYIMIGKREIPISKSYRESFLKSIHYI